MLPAPSAAGCQGRLIGAVPPVMVQSGANPGGIPMEVFDGFRAALSKNRAQFYMDVPSGPFYGFNRDDAKVSQGLIDSWWRQGMAGGAKAHYDCIAAFSETDFTEDLEAITFPSCFCTARMIRSCRSKTPPARQSSWCETARLKSYPGLSHGLFATHPELINADLLAFIREA